MSDDSKKVQIRKCFGLKMFGLKNGSTRKRFFSEMGKVDPNKDEDCC